MTAQRTRMNTISSNIANINTTNTPEGGPYRRKDVVFEAMPDAKSFGEILSTTDPRSRMDRVQVVDALRSIEDRRSGRGSQQLLEPRSRR